MENSYHDYLIHNIIHQFFKKYTNLQIIKTNYNLLNMK